MSTFAENIRHALSVVTELQQKVLERQRFKGFSAKTRSVSGILALATAGVMGSDVYPATPLAHVAGWGAVFVVALLLNAVALTFWFWNDPLVRRDVKRLSPVLDVVPPLFVGGLFTLVMLLHGEFGYLFGIWMCMFGLTNLASRYVLPRAICLVGAFYIVCGVVWLLAPGVSFLNPWPMGIVFFGGELAGGIILHVNDARLRRFLEPSPGEDDDG